MELAFPEKPFKNTWKFVMPHTAQMESAVMPPPTQVIIPMQQHGSPCTPLVKVGMRVLVGQKIADSMAFVSAPIHASVSGRVRAVTQVMPLGGQYVDALVIDSDGEISISSEVQPPKADTRESLLQAVREPDWLDWVRGFQHM